MSERSIERKPDLKSRLRETATAEILDAVESLAIERGAEATSIAAIAERAGVAVGTLYNYFPDRDGMFEALFRARRAEIAPRIAASAAAASQLPFADRLRAYLRGANTAFNEKKAFIQLAIRMDAVSLAPKDTSLLQQMQQHLHDIFRDGAREGVVPEARVEELSHFVIGAMRGLKHSHPESDALYDPDFLTDMILDGVRGAR